MSRFSPLGLAIRRLCDERGSTQRQIAELLGRSPVWVSRLVSGREELPDAGFDAIVVHFGLAGEDADAFRRACDDSRLPLAGAAW